MDFSLTKKAAPIFSIFKIPKLPIHGEAQKAKYRKEVVKQTSTGNVLLQQGYYVTEKDIEQLKKEMIL